LLLGIVVGPILNQQILEAVTIRLTAADEINEHVEFADVGHVTQSSPKLLQVSLEFSPDFHLHGGRDEVTRVHKPCMATNLLSFPEAPVFNK
jgi:hypothetical protein